MERYELEKVKDLLENIGELELLDLLQIEPRDLLDRFEDNIINNYEDIQEAISDLQPTGYY